MNEWHQIHTAPEGVVVETKIDDGRGVRNVTKLVLKQGLWLADDMQGNVRLLQPNALAAGHRHGGAG
jgi:hypothetical protein